MGREESAKALNNSLVRPSISLRYAQGERTFLPFVLSVARRAESKYERSPHPHIN